MCDNNTVRSHRKTSKPMMEKRRRARINQSLAELKDLIVCCDKYELEAQNEKKLASVLETRKNCRRTNRAKLEKADILELTVRHLHRLHDGKTEIDKSKDSLKDGQEEKVMEKFRDGFHECVQEIERFLNHNNDQVALDKPSKGRLFEHLKTRLQGLNVQHTCTNHTNPSNTAQVQRVTMDNNDSESLQVPPTTKSSKVEKTISCDHHHHHHSGQTGHLEQPPVKKNIIQVKVKSKAGSVQHLIRIRPEEVRVDVWRPW